MREPDKQETGSMNSSTASIVSAAVADMIHVSTQDEQLLDPGTAESLLQVDLVVVISRR